MADDVTRPEDAGPTDEDATPMPDRSLAGRWWWQAFVVGITGVVVIGFQWNVVRDGEAIAATWAMIALGVAAVVAGCVIAWRTRPGRPADDGPDTDG